MGSAICTVAVGAARSAGFVRDFISVVPFFACEAPACLLAGERNRHLQFTRSTETGTSPAPPKKLQPTPRGDGLAAALEKCRELADLHAARADTGGLREAKAEKRKTFLAQKAVEAVKSERTLQKLLDAYVTHLKTQGRRSHVDADPIFKRHVAEAWPRVAEAPAVDLTPDQVLDMLRRLIEANKRRTANKLRSYLRAAFQCALDVRTTASIPVVFKSFGVVFNPSAQTRRSLQFDRAEKRPFSKADLQAYWKLISARPGIEAAALRLHLLAGGQRIEQFVRLKWADVRDEALTIFDGKGRPGQGPRPACCSSMGSIASSRCNRCSAAR
jgi:hypothetical protein